MKIKINKKFFQNAIVGLAILFCFIGLCFPMFYWSPHEGTKFVYNGFTILSLNETESGLGWYKAECVLQIVFSGLMLVAFIASLVLPRFLSIEEKRVSSVRLGIVVLCAFFALLYMIDGFAFCHDFNKDMRELGSSIRAYSFGVIPFIFELLFLGGYILLNWFVDIPTLYEVDVPLTSASHSSRNEREAEASSSQPSGSSALDDQEKKIALLKQYKELLDSGVVTQEEFDAKKTELLK